MKAAKDQGDTGLEFDGAGGTGYSRGNGTKYSGNMAKQTMKPNYGRGPTTVGAETEASDYAGPSMVKPIGTKYNPDRINMGCGPRDAGSTRPFMPSATMNYRGNPDMMNVGRGPTKGNQK